MSKCTFFGHRDCPSVIRPKLQVVLEELIDHYGVDTFYVGKQGRFDALVYHTLQQLKKTYPHIRFVVVLAYMPTDTTNGDQWEDTILPDGVELTPPRYAILKCNDWMLKQSDYVVTYITHPFGGAYRYAEKAARQGKTIINLAGE